MHRTALGFAGLAFSIFFAGFAFAQASWSALPFEDAELPCAGRIPGVQFDPHRAHHLPNVLLLLLASHVAEYEEREAIQKQLKDWGFQNTLLFGAPHQGAYAYLAEHETFQLLSFRGTKSTEEAVIDALFLPVSYESIGIEGRGHWGMREQFRRLASLILPEVLARANVSAKPVFLTGHSLGGALALLHALRLKQLGIDVRAIYTSAQPRVGDQRFYAEVLEELGDRYFRLEQPMDPTPRVPPSFDVAESFAQLLTESKGALGQGLAGWVRKLAYFRPKERTMHLDESLSVSEGDDPDADRRYWELFAASLQDRTSWAGIQAQLKLRMAEHSPRRYICRLLELAEVQDRW